MIEILPTNTCPPDWEELSRRSKRIAEFSPWMQLDIGDGKFIPATSWPYAEGQAQQLEQMAERALSLPNIPELSYEIHLMVEEPLEVGNVLAKGGAKRIIAQVEGFADKREVLYALDSWKGKHCEVGLSILLDTPLAVIGPVISACSVVQCMSIASLGYQGAPYEPRVVDRIKELRAAYPNITIEVDGGVSQMNIASLARAGASRFGVGSAVMKAENPEDAYQKLLALAEDAIQ